MWLRSGMEEDLIHPETTAAPDGIPNKDTAANLVRAGSLGTLR